MACTESSRSGAEGTAGAKWYGDSSGFFWFFTRDNIELVVKALDARAVNGHFWFFYGALSDVGYTQEPPPPPGQIKTPPCPPRRRTAPG
jgi:hypothetical protein